MTQTLPYTKTKTNAYIEAVGRRAISAMYALFSMFCLLARSRASFYDEYVMSRLDAVLDALDREQQR